jgi:hypothetical protein
MCQSELLFSNVSMCLSCNIKKSKTQAKLSENNWNKRCSNCFEWCHHSQPTSFCSSYSLKLSEEAAYWFYCLWLYQTWAGTNDLLHLRSHFFSFFVCFIFSLLNVEEKLVNKLQSNCFCDHLFFVTLFQCSDGRSHQTNLTVLISKTKFYCYSW